MNKDFLIKLTTNLYRLTLLFPKKEPLRFKMRELADEILADSLRITNKHEYTNPSKKTEDGPLQILGELEVLDGYFEVAKSQNWVSPQNILYLQQKYSKLKEDLKQLSDSNPLTALPEGPSAKPLIIKGAFLERQEKILEFLKEKGKAQVWEIQKIFPEVTKRTLRRDFEQMLNQGLVERIGERNETFYQLKG